MRGSSRVGIYFAAGLVILCAAPMAAVFGFLWLFRDEEPFTAGCSGGLGGTCDGGETANMIAALGLAAVVLLAITVVMVTARRARSERPDRVRRDGTRVPGVLVDRENGVTGHGEAFYDLRFEGRSPDGGKAVATVRTPHPLPDGTPVTLAFHPKRPAQAVVVEDLDQLAASMLSGAAS